MSLNKIPRASAEEMEGTVVLSCDRDHRGDEQRREWGRGGR